MKKKIGFIGLLIVFLLGCTAAPIIVETNGTARWVAGYTINTYAKHDGICLASTEVLGVKTCILHAEDYSWDETEGPFLEGTDYNPTLPGMDCKKEFPEDPEVGNIVCVPYTKYFLDFSIETDKISLEIPKEVWEVHEPSKIYKLQKGGWEGWFLVD